MSILSGWLSSSAPDAAVEITAGRVSVAAVALRGGTPVVTAHGSEALPAGAVVPSLSATNITDVPATRAALTRLLERVSLKPTRVALVIPDSAAKLSVVHFDHIPSKRDDLDQLVRWQLRKSTPFPIDEAVVSYTPGASVASGGREFVVTVARRSVIREYEGMCESLGAQPGLVDLATVSLVNMYLAAPTAPVGDWLVVHVRADSTSIVIMRGGDLIFHRNRSDGEHDSIIDLVQQTAMYYQDRLAGERFSRVLVAGLGRGADGAELVRRSLGERLGVAVETVDPTQSARLTDRISPSAELLDTLGPLVGVSLRALARGVAA